MAKQFQSFKSQTAPPKVLISIVSQEHAKYTKFWASLQSLISETPNCYIDFRIGNQLTKARNDAVEAAQKFGADYLWFIDDDHEFKPDTLNRLLAHKKDIIGPLYCIRGYPFDPTARRLDGSARQIFNVPDSGPPGLHKVRATGTSGLLIAKKVWETIDRPWFAVGHLHQEMISEDFYFCETAADAGFDTWLDTSTIIEHIASMKVSIDYVSDKWKIIIDMGQEQRLALDYNVKEGIEAELTGESN